MIDRRLSLGLALLALLLGTVIWAFDGGVAWSRLIAFTVTMQHELHQGLATALRAVKESGPAAGLWLVTLGFLYGVFHAAGPGHGKVVIATYLGTQRESLGRGVALAFAAALLQGVVAIALVGATVLVLARTARQTQFLTDRLETLSFAAMVLLGLYLVWRAGRSLFRPAAAGCGHDHHHAPPPSRAFGAALLSIGLRPCSGAILVLVLAFALDLRVTGIAAVLAMSLGTALTVAALAALAVLARDRAAAFAARLDRDGRRIARIGDLIALLGGMLITALGLALLQASLSTPTHPLF